MKNRLVNHPVSAGRGSGKSAFQADLGGETAIVTGASGGIGRSIAIALAEAGADVVVHYHSNPKGADETVNHCLEHGVRSLAVQGDVSDALQVERLMEQATALGSPGILINNAGIALEKLVMDTTLEEWNRIIATNLTGPFLCSKAILPHLLRKRWGRIVNISSIWGITGAATEAAYAASKGGLVTFTKSLARELASANITVNAVAPGAIETDMIGQLSDEDRQVLVEEIPIGRIGHPEDVAHLVTFLVSRAAAYITGEIFRIDGGWIP